MANKGLKRKMAQPITSAKKSNLDLIDSEMEDDVDVNIDNDILNVMKPIIDTIKYVGQNVEEDLVLKKLINITEEDFVSTYNKLGKHKIVLKNAKSKEERNNVSRVFKTIYKRRFDELQKTTYDKYNLVIIMKLLISLCSLYVNANYKILHSMTERKGISFELDDSDYFNDILDDDEPIIDATENENNEEKSDISIYYTNNIADFINTVILFFSHFDFPNNSKFSNRFTAKKILSKDEKIDAVALTFEKPVLVQIEEEVYGDKQVHFVVCKDTSTELLNLIKNVFPGEYEFNSMSNVNVCKYNKTNMFSNSFCLDKGTNEKLNKNNVMLAMVKAIDFYPVKNYYYAKAYLNIMNIDGEDLLILSSSKF